MTGSRMDEHSKVHRECYRLLSHTCSNGLELCMENPRVRNIFLVLFYYYAELSCFVAFH